MPNNQTQKGGDGSTQTQICTQNNYNITITGDIVPSEFVKLFNSISSTFVTRDEFQSFQKNLNESLSKVNKDDVITPSLNIWGATVDSLKWNLGDQQKHIRDMFINILTSDIDKTKKSKVQPSFIEIVKQLSAADARFLKAIKSNSHDIYEIVFRMVIPPKSPVFNTVKELVPDLVNRGLNHEHCEFRVIKINKEWEKLDEIVIDNLERLKIISIENKVYGFGDQESIKSDICSKFSIISSEKSDGISHSTRFVRRMSSINFTDYGKALIETIL